MAGRLNYYFRQKVTEAELDLGFSLLEAGDFALASDNGLVGIVNGAAVTQRTAGANLTVDVAAGIVYDKLGRRIAWGAVQNVDLSVDESAVSTAVITPGNTKVLSIFAKFDRNLTDPRIDGNGNTVYFNEAESFELLVRQGAESAGTPTPPGLDPEYILIADVVRRNPQPAITNGDIVDHPLYGAPPVLSVRREAAFVFSVGAMAVRERTAEASDQAVLQHLQDHIVDVSAAHAGSAIAHTPTTTWADGGTIAATTVSAALNEIVQDLANSSTTVGFNAGGTLWGDATSIAATNVRDAIREVVSDLASQVAATSGAHKVGAASRTPWLGGRTNPAGSVHGALEAVITDLAATAAADDGASRIGAEAVGNLTAGSVRSQLNELDTEKAATAVINVYSAGTHTWTKPAGAKWVEVLLLGGGGGGGSGRRGAALTNRFGGNGGGGGGRTHARFSASLLSATETIVVGAAGLGGAAQTADNSNGNDGTAGGSSTFTVGGSIAARAAGGDAGDAGRTGAMGAAAGGYGDFPGGDGGGGNAISGGNDAPNTFAVTASVIVAAGAAGGGGAGGGVDSTNVAYDGGNGGWVQRSYGGGTGFGTGGVVGGASPTQGTSVATDVVAGGGGGGGGAGNASGIAQDGARAGSYGGGGGGGGASANGFASGEGGDGKAGIGIVVTYF